MNESWKNHIQPVLDSWEWDHFSWVWDPFLAKYPEFNVEQQAQVDDALVSCAFDLTDEKLAIKALSIAENLYRSQLATPRLLELFRSELRKQFETLDLEREISHHYVFAFATFELKEAIPFIKSEIDSLEEMQLENVPDERKSSYLVLFRACSLSLLLLKADNAILYFVRNIGYDLRIRTLTPNVSSWGLVDLINFWQHIGVDGLKTLTKNMQSWQQDKLAMALPELVMASEKIHYSNAQEKQEVKMLIEDLQNSIAAT